MSDNNNWNILKGTDLISESMNKINENFRILKERDDMDDYKWSGYVESITKELENLKKSINEKNSEISNNLTNMDNKINNIPTVTNIKTQVEQAILNAEDTLANVIQSRAGQYVEEKMGDYAKTSTVDNISTSFEQYKASAAEKTASADRIVANSKFYTVFDENVEKSFLVYLDNSTSQYENVGQYYDENKGTIDPDNKGISDPDVMRELEQTFKTTSTELTSFHQEVAEGLAEVDIIAKIEDDDNEDGKDIVAAIITRANNEGSEIQLNADNIKLNADHQLSLTTGTFTVNTNNFKLDGDGDVEITGKITATSGKIGNLTINQDGSLTNGNFTLASNGKLTVTGAEITGTIEATSGSIGGITIASNEIKSLNNNFSVTSGGKLIASDAEITGKITAKSGSIGGITIASNEIKSSNNNFSVTSAGKLIASDANLTGTIEAIGMKYHYDYGESQELFRYCGSEPNTGGSLYSFWKIKSDGSTHMKSGGHMHNTNIVYFDPDNYSSFGGKSYHFMVPPVYMTASNKMYVMGSVNMPYGSGPTYAFNNAEGNSDPEYKENFRKALNPKVKFIHPLLDSFPAWIEINSQGYLALEFVWDDLNSELYAYIISHHNCNAVFTTNGTSDLVYSAKHLNDNTTYEYYGLDQYDMLAKYLIED